MRRQWITWINQKWWYLWYFFPHIWFPSWAGCLGFWTSDSKSYFWCSPPSKIFSSFLLFPIFPSFKLFPIAIILYFRIAYFHLHFHLWSIPIIRDIKGNKEERVIIHQFFFHEVASWLFKDASWVLQLLIFHALEKPMKVSF